MIYKKILDYFKHKKLAKEQENLEKEEEAEEKYRQIQAHESFDKCPTIRLMARSAISNFWETNNIERYNKQIETIYELLEWHRKEFEKGKS